MKSVSCKDMGTDCPFVAKGETAKEVKEDMWKHAEKIHPELLENATKEEVKGMEDMMDKLMKSD